MWLLDALICALSSPLFTPPPGENTTSSCTHLSHCTVTVAVMCALLFTDTGPIAVIPQPCTEVQTGEAAINRAQYGGAVFNCKIEGQDFEEFTSVKKGLPATLSTKQKRKLIVVPLTYLLDDGTVCVYMYMYTV